MIPRPPKKAATTKPRRTATTPTPRASATPPATPPNRRWSRRLPSRRGGEVAGTGRSAAGGGVMGSVAVGSVAVGWVGGASMDRSSVIRGGGDHRECPREQPRATPDAIGGRPHPDRRVGVRSSGPRPPPSPPAAHPRADRLEEPDVQHSPG